jgi:hypothetical protein
MLRQMNERILQLAEQSGFYYTTKTGFIAPAGCDPAKFAELIVRECIEQIITGPNGPAHYAMEAALRVKEHFGVEE